MYIATCDDNIADRKQLERLLQREADRRAITDEPFYIDSYGSSASLLASPINYDAYFCDITQSSPDIWKTIADIRNKSAISPIVLCSSKIDYSTCSSLPTHSYVIKKPIKVAELTALCTSLLKDKADNFYYKMTFRNKTTTFTMREEEFLYCHGSGFSTTIHGSDGSIYHSSDSLFDLWMDFVPFHTLVMPNNTTIVNARYIKEISHFHIIMNDNTKLSLKPTLYHPLKKLMREI